MSYTIRRVSLLCVAAAMLFAAADVRAQVGQRLVPTGAARQAQLESLWATSLRVDPARGRVQSIRFHSNLVFAQTSLGIVQALDAETGRTYWATEVGSANLETTPPSINDKYVAVTNGSTLYVLSRSTGAILFTQRVGGAPSAGTACSETEAVVPLASGIVEAFKLKRESRVDEIPQRHSGAGSPSVAPIIVGNRTLWSTPTGYIYSRELTKTMSQFRFRLDDHVDAAPAYMSPFVFAASRSGRVYAISDDRGLEVWQFPTEVPISQPIITIDGKLYVITDKAEMYRIDPRLGTQIWYSTGIASFLSMSLNRIYGLDPQGRITVLDANTGSLLATVAGTGGYDVPTVNMETDRIYLCDSTGLLQCLREVRETKDHPEWSKPMYHSRGYTIPPPKKPGAAAPADGAMPADGAAPAAGAAPADPANPFGT